MSTAVAAPLSELRARARAAIILCNAGDEVQEAQIAGIFYTFPPGEKVEIQDRLDWKRGAKGVLLTSEPKVLLDGADAVTIASEILSEADNRLGSRGVTVLFGDVQDDARLKIARQTYVRYRVERAKHAQRQWLYKVEKATKEPGALPPAQPDTVRAEIAFLSRYEAGLIDRKKFICKLDGYESDNRAELVAYITRTYGQQVAQANGDAAAYIVDRDAAVAKEAPNAGVEPVLPTVPPAPASPAPSITDTAYLIATADALKVPYTKAELVGLINNDPDVVKALAEKVVAVARKREASNG